MNIKGLQLVEDLTSDITGSATFKEHAGGTEGSITLYLKNASATNYANYGTKTYEGTSVNWKYSDFAGSRLNPSIWGGKEIMVKIVATAANGATKTSEKKGSSHETVRKNSLTN